jgi:phospholipase C
MKMKKSGAWKGAGIGLAAAALVGGAFTTLNSPASHAADTYTLGSPTTPIKHVVVLFDENVSFDHYFGTYPYATNADGTPFQAIPGTKVPDNYVSHPDMLTDNPNLVAPFRLGAGNAVTCDQGHNYTPEEKALDGGAGDKFVENVTNDTCGQYNRLGTTMGYYDGNTVTAMWNYAQNYAMSDNSWSNTFGPSTPGALELVSGQTHGVQSYLGGTTNKINTENPALTAKPDTYAVRAPDSNGVGTVIKDPDPAYDDCADYDQSSSSALAAMQSSNKNVGNLLDTAKVTWGWFEGGFAPSTAWNGSGTYAQCNTFTKGKEPGLGVGGTTLSASATSGSATIPSGTTVDGDYIPHHDPFQYYASTANPHHFPGTTGVAVGSDDPTNDTSKTGANHQYDLSVFDQAVAANQLPAVSFVKAAAAQDGHASYSDPIDEQYFLVHTINEIEQSPAWSSTAIIVAYDDSDGWYDHVVPTIENSSHVTGANNTDGVADDDTICTSSTAPVAGGYQDRCGPGTRLPFLVISPYAKKNYISHTEITQASILKFIEQNWSLGTIGDSSFDSTTGSIDDMFNFKATPDTTPVLLRNNGSVMSGGDAGKLTSLYTKLAKDQRALTAAEKAAKKAKGAMKKAANKKVAALKKTVAKDKAAMAAADRQ